MTGRRLLGACAVAAVALLAPACGSGGASGGGAPISTAHRTDPNFDFGQTVTITTSGFRPRQIVTLLGRPVQWRNSSGVTQSVVFDHFPQRSGPIPPGGTWTFTPRNEISITYHSGTRPELHGAVEVTPGS